jgi:hypothetical protein
VSRNVGPRAAVTLDVMTELRSGRGFLRRALDRMAQAPEDRAAEELRRECAADGIDPVSSTVERRLCTVKGEIRTVTLAPRAGLPALEAELYDGSGALTLVWIGRRRIAGIEPGRMVTASGRVAMIEGKRVVFNPRYELQSSAAGQ